MAVKYLRSGAAGAGTGADWTNAYTTLTLGLAGLAAGDTLYVADDHAESSGTALTFASPGTAGAPCRIICVNTHVTTPPTGTATTATISTTGTVSMTFSTGHAYYYGITFSATNSSSTNAIIINGTNTAFGFVFDSCAIQIGAGNTASTAAYSWGNSGTVVENYLTLRNTTVKFTNAGQTINLRACRLLWLNTASAVLGTAPTILFTPANTGPNLELSGVDLSLMGSGTSIIKASSALVYRAYIRNCKLGASVSVISGTINSPGGCEVYLDNADSGATNYRMEHYKYQGSTKNETTHVRTTGGATDGTTPISHNLTTLATGPTLFSPLEGPWVSVWNEISGVSKTVTMELCTENVALFNDDAWLEVEYLGTANFPESVYANNRVADAFATHAALTTSTVGWSGFTTASPQSVAVTFTPQSKGLIRARLCVAKASATIYADPLLTVS